MIDPVTNFAKAEVSAGYGAAAVSIVLSTGTGALFPDPDTDGEFNLVWWDSTTYSDPSDDPDKEIVRCTARSSDTLTITRAQEGTSSVAHNTSGKTYKVILPLTKKTIDDIRANLWVHDYTPSEVVNGTNAVFTLPAASQVIVYADGVRTKGIGNDYTFSGNTTVTFGAGKQPYSTISIDYLPL
jgi:hypothetical protein